MHGPTSDSASKRGCISGRAGSVSGFRSSHRGSGSAAGFITGCARWRHIGRSGSMFVKTRCGQVWCRNLTTGRGRARCMSCLGMCDRGRDVLLRVPILSPLRPRKFGTRRSIVPTQRNGPAAPVGRLSRAAPEKFPADFPDSYVGLGLRGKVRARVMAWSDELSARWPGLGGNGGLDRRDGGCKPPPRSTLGVVAGDAGGTGGIPEVAASFRL